MTKKYPWTWQHMFRPSVHHRPPFPMTTRERLYEVRKRHRKTEIRSERVEIDLTLGHEFCRFCLDLEDGKCLAACSPIDFCPYSEELAAYKRRGETKARFHRMSRKERLYERRKHLKQKADAFHRAARRALRNRQWNLRDRCLLRYQMTRLWLEMKTF